MCWWWWKDWIKSVHAKYWANKTCGKPQSRGVQCNGWNCLYVTRCFGGSHCLQWSWTVWQWFVAPELENFVIVVGEMIQQTVDTLCSTTNLRNRRVTKTRHEWAISKPAAVRNWEERGTLQNSFRLWRYFYQILTQNTYSQPSAKIVMTVWFYQTCKVSRERRSILNKSASV